MANSEIQWTDFTWNPTTGCNKVSQGCKFCYAESIANRFWGDRKFTDVLTHPDRLEQIDKLRKPRMIFVNSMSDLFHPKVPFEFVDKIINVIFRNQKHIFQVLTKQPQRMKNFFSGGYNMVRTPNLWLGVSTENQATADERIPILLETPARVRWISAEPLLGPIDLNKLELLIDKKRFYYTMAQYLDWVVVGCESGPKRRECKIEWVEDIVDQCKEANVPVFVKQLQIDGKVLKNIEDFPKHLQIREYPNV